MTIDSQRAKWDNSIVTPVMPDPILSGDDMSISESDLAAIAKAVWTTDGVIPSPTGNKSNPFWQPQRILADLGTQVRAIEAAIAALSVTPPPPPPATSAASTASTAVAGVLAGRDPAQVADAIVTSLGPEAGQQVVTALQARLAAAPPAS
jgi:ABC-type glycerol-3-phosphate transport system substrate-binding protein